MAETGITRKATPEPLAAAPIVDAYLRAALLAAEEVVGAAGLATLLRQIGLAQLVNNYPPDLPVASGQVTFGDYSTLCVGLLTSFGSAGKSMMLRIGRLSAKYALLRQSEVFKVAELNTVKTLPRDQQLRFGLEILQAGYRTLMPELKLRIEDHGEAWAYVAETCPMCIGYAAHEPLCWAFDGVLQEAAYVQSGKIFAVKEVACRAQGDPACVWEISKQPSE
ncbi:divinyl protochlorophyllide a 8-vinyl-reductase [Thermoflexales bacterium]|nr:divinyl protochlorophyllide a 8-vinyl-reductase [Thermoflexales bacterium]